VRLDRTKFGIARVVGGGLAHVAGEALFNRAEASVVELRLCQRHEVGLIAEGREA